MRKPLTILGVTYTKTSFAAKWKEVVDNTGVNLSVPKLHEAFVREALSKTSRWSTLASRPSTVFKVRARKFQGRAVKGLTMIDSSKEVWVGKGQLVDALFPPPPITAEKCNKKQALAALRQIIEPQIKTFRSSILRQLERKPVRCKISHDFLERGKFHVDHVYPFKLLVEDWCREYRVDLESIETYCKGTKCYIKDISLAESWFDYHLVNAQLQAVNSIVNLQKGSKFYG